MKKMLKKLIPETSVIRLTYHRSKALLAALLYGMPARGLTVIGITGTDGKTTTVGMLAHILNASGKKCGALSTAFFQIGDETTWNPTQKTSPSPFTVQKFLRKCRAARCMHVILECSSHGLLQGRVNYTWPMVAGITNLSEEHLDYHGTMDEYLRAKSRLFSMLRKNCGVSVLNADDRSYTVLRHMHTFHRIDYSTKRILEKTDNDRTSGLWLTQVRSEKDRLSGTLHTSAETDLHELTLPIAGSFNLSNALCAIGCAQALNIPLRDSVSALRSFPGIPGRLERIDAGQEFSVYVDFTVTPQSYESTLATLKASLRPSSRLLVLTGSCGDRMKEKRPVVGRIVSTFADITVVTNEDPYTEDPETIIDEIWSGIDQTKTDAHRMSDRRQAIAYLLKQAKKNDIVLLCGKGSDTTMWVKTGQVPWNEREIVAEELRALR